VGIETEIKVSVSDSEDFRRRLDLLKPVLLSPRHFEDNYVLDYPDQRLRTRQCLVRLRTTDDSSYLTFKGPPVPEGKFKVREECETKLGDPAMGLRILEELGLLIWFRYQKYRQEYLVRTGEGEVHVVLDETPVGVYAEFEGTEEAIRRVAETMGFDESCFIRESYYSLYAEFCRARGQAPGHMVFSHEP
jgi:adenylate cyclase, class 2